MTMMAERIRGQHTSLTGWQINQSLKSLGVSHRRFTRHTGMNETRVGRMLKGDMDGDIPLWIELVLKLYHVMPELRETDESVELPLEEWGAEAPDPSASD
jgi:hypothetical protein